MNGEYFKSIRRIDDLMRRKIKIVLRNGVTLKTGLEFLKASIQKVEEGKQSGPAPEISLQKLEREYENCKRHLFRKMGSSKEFEVLKFNLLYGLGKNGYKVKPRDIFLHDISFSATRVFTVYGVESDINIEFEIIIGNGIFSIKYQLPKNGLTKGRFKNYRYFHANECPDHLHVLVNHFGFGLLERLITENMQEIKELEKLSSHIRSEKYFRIHKRWLPGVREIRGLQTGVQVIEMVLDSGVSFYILKESLENEIQKLKKRETSKLRKAM